MRASLLNYRDLMVLEGRGRGPIRPDYLTDRLGAKAAYRHFQARGHFGKIVISHS